MRVSLMEAGAEWTVPVIRRLKERKAQLVDEVLGQRVFVACAVDEDLRRIIEKWASTSWSRRPTTLAVIRSERITLLRA